MAYTPKFGRLPKDDDPINSASDEADRSLHEVERDNEQYYLEQKKIAENVTRIQSGVKASAAATLKRRAGGGDNVDILIGEKVQNELYKAVEGNDVYESEKGDNKNLEGSLSAEYMRSGKLGKFKMKAKRMVRGALAYVGANSYVEAEVAKRFGTQYVEETLVDIKGKKITYETNVSKSIDQRKGFVLGRLKKVFYQFEDKDLLECARIFYPKLDEKFNLSIPELKTDVINLLLRVFVQERKADFGRIRASEGVKNLISSVRNSQEFKDLLLISDIEQRESAKVGVEGVYDAERLHDFWNRIRFSKGVHVSVDKAVEKERDVEEEVEEAPVELEEKPKEDATVDSEISSNDIEWDSFEDDKEKVKNAETKQKVASGIPDLEPFPPLKVPKKPIRSRYGSVNFESTSDKDSKRRKIKKKVVRKEKYIEIEKGKVIAINPLGELGVVFESVVKNNSMWPLEKHREGLALMALFQYRLKTIKYDDAKVKIYTQQLRANLRFENMDDVTKKNALEETERMALEFAKADALKAELIDIGSDVPPRIIESEEVKRKEVNKLQEEVYNGYRDLEHSYTIVSGMGLELAKARIEAENAKTNADKAVTPDEIKRTGIAATEAERRKNELFEEREKGFVELQKKEGVFGKNVMNLRRGLNEIKRNSFEEIPIIGRILNSEPTTRADLEVSANKATPNSLYAILKPENESSWIKIQLQIDKIQGEVMQLTPFQLLQKMLRREYLERRNPEHDPKHFHERAARYSLLTAAMRVQDAKNVDLHRNVNKKVADYLKQYKIGKVYGKAASGLNFAGRKIGIEMIEGDKESVDSLLEQIVQSDSRFEVFRGINKYTTPRDLRKTLYESGKEVSLETMEEFIAILENVLEGVKKGDDKYLKTLMLGDWDLESLVLTLQKFKLEKWTQQYMDKVIASEGNREHALLDLLREKREEDEKINKEIHRDVRSSDAMWKRQLSKNAIKDALNEKVLITNEQIKGVGIEKSKAEIAGLEEAIKDLPDDDLRKIKGLREIDNLRNGIAKNEKEISKSRDLYERVAAFKETLEKESLSRKQSKELAAKMGLGQIYDKMGMNFRVERYWKKTKSALKIAAGWSWDKTKKGWGWAGGKVFKKENARKAFSLARAGASPVTYPLGLAWKVGTFPVRLAGRAMAGAASLPGGIWRRVYSPSMKSYLRDFPIDINFKKEKLEDQKKDLKEDLAKAPYNRDKKRIMLKINRLDEKIEALDGKLSQAREKASKLGLTI